VQLFFPKEVGRSLLYDPGGNLAGSALIGQPAFFRRLLVKHGGQT